MQIQNGDPYGVAGSILLKVKAELDKVRAMIKEKKKGGAKRNDK